MSVNRWGIAAALLGVVTGTAVVVSPLIALAVPFVALALYVMARWHWAVAPLLLVLAAPFSRPNLLGEQYATVGLGLAVLAALIALAADRGRISFTRAGRVPLFLGLAYLSLLLAQPATAVSGSAGVIVGGAALVIGVTVCAAIVLSDERRRNVAVKAFVALVLLMCASYVITAVYWRAADVGSGFVGLVSGDRLVFFPATPTLGTVHFAGVEMPRFTGLGREPGWMGMWIAVTWFLAGLVGWGRWSVRLLLLAGLIGTFSAAAFAIFVMAWTYNRFLRGDRGQLVKLLGFAAVAAAGWVAWQAPVIGLEAKLANDVYSVGERQASTLAGWDLLLHGNPFMGGQGVAVVGGVNLIAAVAAFGLLFSVFTVAALFAPRVGHPAKSLTTAPVAVLFVTLLVTQPPRDSTWVYVAAVMAYAAARPSQDVDGLDDGAGGVPPVGAVRPRRVIQGRVVVGAADPGQ